MTNPTPDAWPIDVARAGMALYWALYYAPETTKSLPDSVLKAYAKCQKVMGP